MQHDDPPPLHLTRLHQRWPCSFLPRLPSTFASSPSMFDDLAFPPCFSIFFIILFLSIIFTTNASICQPTSPPLYIRLFSNYTIDMTNNTTKKEPHPTPPPPSPSPSSQTHTSTVKTHSLHPTPFFSGTRRSQIPRFSRRRDFFYSVLLFNSAFCGPIAGATVFAESKEEEQG